MLKKCKQLILGVVIGGLLFGVVPAIANTLRTFTAEEASFPVLVNGVEVKLDMPIVTIEGRTYMPLRALGDVLGVKVDWNDEKQRAEVIKEGDKVNQESNSDVNEANVKYKIINGIEMINVTDLNDYFNKILITGCFVSYGEKFCNIVQGGTLEFLENVSYEKIDGIMYLTRNTVENIIMPWVKEHTLEHLRK